MQPEFKPSPVAMVTCCYLAVLGLASILSANNCLSQREEKSQSDQISYANKLISEWDTMTQMCYKPVSEIMKKMPWILEARR